MSKDWYIWLDGIKVSVTEEVYRIYKRADWREEKQDTVRRDRECSFDYMMEHDFDSIAFRATKAECLDLPEMTDIIRYVELEPTAMKVYRDC